MKKFLILLTALLCLNAATALAAEEPLITSDKRTFNILTGVYDLQGNVTVKFPSDRMDLIISGDAAQVSLYKMEVHAQGNISLQCDKDTSFACDRVDVYHKNRTAYVTGSAVFRCGSDTITADRGAYCWKTKLAVFSGSVSVNGKAHPGDVEYNVKEKRLTKY